ncbi:MAG TPA: hypothetical protein P5092_04270 [Ruminococcus sp.]|nr:hypothetical protein [Ruminococcus sp.]
MSNGGIKISKGLVLFVPKDECEKAPLGLRSITINSCAEYFDNHGRYLYNYERYDSSRNISFSDFVKLEVCGSWKNWDKLDVMDISFDDFKAAARDPSLASNRKGFPCIDFNEYHYIISKGDVTIEEAESFRRWIRNRRVLNKNVQTVNFNILFRHIKSPNAL